MTHTDISPRLAMRWVPSTDERGRTRMEARWIVVDETESSTRSDAA